MPAGSQSTSSCGWRLEGTIRSRITTVGMVFCAASAVATLQPE